MEDHGLTVEITDWEAATAELKRFCAGGTFHAESDVASCTVGSATIEIHSDGRLEGSMPLHAFDGRIDVLEFDHVGGTITAESEELSYTFRRP